MKGKVLTKSTSFFLSFFAVLFCLMYACIWSNNQPHSLVTITIHKQTELAYLQNSQLKERELHKGTPFLYMLTRELKFHPRLPKASCFRYKFHNFSYFLSAYFNSLVSLSLNQQTSFAKRVKMAAEVLASLYGSDSGEDMATGYWYGPRTSCWRKEQRRRKRGSRERERWVVTQLLLI